MTTIKRAPFTSIDSGKGNKYANIALLLPSDAEDSLDDVIYELDKAEIEYAQLDAAEDPDNSQYVMVLELNRKMSKTQLSESFPNSWRDVEIKTFLKVKKAREYVSDLKKASPPAGMSREEWQAKKDERERILEMDDDQIVQMCFIDIMGKWQEERGAQEVEEGKKYAPKYIKTEAEEELDRAIAEQERAEARAHEINNLIQMGIAQEEAISRFNSKAQEMALKEAALEEQRKQARAEWVKKQEDNLAELKAKKRASETTLNSLALGKAPKKAPKKALKKASKKAPVKLATIIFEEE